MQTGIDKHITADTTLGGVMYKPGALKTVFATAITALNAADALRKQWTDGVLAAHQAKATADALYELLRSSVIAQFGKQANAVLGDFGMPVPKVKGPKTAAQKATAAAKAKATRQMRKTMGSKQKQAVKGTVEVPNPELSGAGAAPALPVAPPTPTPASPAAPGVGTKSAG